MIRVARRALALLAPAVLWWLASGCGDHSPRSGIVFEEDSISLGRINAGASKEVRFPFRNTGRRPLQIKNVDVSCGCLSPQFPQQVPPGGAGEVKVRFEPQAWWSGPVTKELTVYTNDPRHRSLPLHLDADIVPYVRVEPPGPVDVQYQRGAVVQRDLRLIPRPGASLAFKGVSSKSPLVKATLRPAAAGDPRGAATLHLDIGPVRSWGDVSTSVQIGTTESQLPVLPISVNLQAPDGPVVDPTEVSLTAVTAGSSDETLTKQPLRLFTRSGSLHVISIETGTPLIRAEIDPRIPDREYWITLRRAGAWTPGDVRTEIRIRTDDSAFPEVDIPFEALVVQPPTK